MAEVPLEVGNPAEVSLEVRRAEVSLQDSAAAAAMALAVVVVEVLWWCSSRDHSLFQLWGLPNSTTSQYVSAVQTCTDFPSGPVPDLPCPAAAAQPVRGPRSRRVEVGPEPFWEADLWGCCSLVAVGAKSNLLFGDYACPDSTDLSEFASGGIEFPTPSRGGLNLALAGPCN